MDLEPISHQAIQFIQDTLANRRVPHPKVTLAADTHEAMREEFEYMLEHAAGGTCGCSTCHRYLTMRALLLEMWQ